MNHANISRRAKRGGYVDLMKAKHAGYVEGKIGKLPGLSERDGFWSRSRPLKEIPQDGFPSFCLVVAHAP